jgi:hypothetical protein
VRRQNWISLEKILYIHIGVNGVIQHCYTRYYHLKVSRITEQYNVVMAFIDTAAVIKWPYELKGPLLPRLDLPENDVIDQGFLSIHMTLEFTFRHAFKAVTQPAIKL